MPHNHWQYLAHSEPVLPTPRVTNQSHQWRPSLPDLPMRRPGLPTALLVAASAFVFAPAPAAPTPRVFGLLDVPSRAVARCASFATGAERVLEVPRSQHVTWYQQLSEPVRAARPMVVGTGAEFVRAPAPVIAVQLAWHQTLSEPRRAAPFLVAGTGAEFVRAPAPAVAVQLAWYRPLSEPLRTRAPVVGESVGPVRIIPRVISADIQGATASQPLAVPVWGRPRCVDFATGAESYFGPAIISQVVGPLFMVDRSRPFYAAEDRSRDFYTAQDRSRPLYQVE